MIIKKKGTTKTEYRRRKTEVKKESKYIDETTRRYIYVQTAATLFNYFKELEPEYIPKHGPLREFCKEVFILCGTYLQREFASAAKTDTRPEKQEKTCKTPLKAITQQEIKELME